MGQIFGRDREAVHMSGHVLIVDDGGGMRVDDHLLEQMGTQDLKELVRQLVRILEDTRPRFPEDDG